MNNEIISPGSVFISSAKEDQDRVERLVKYLSKIGFNILWWGRDIEGSWLNDESLQDAACVVVVWTLASVDNESIRDEASKGQERGILLPILLDSSASIPDNFKGLPYHDLTHWDGKDDTTLQHLADRIESLVARGRASPDIRIR